jgi:hypothetical protein
MVGRAAACVADRARAAELEADARTLEAELDAVGASVLERSWREVEPGRIESVPLDLLRDRIARARPAPPQTRPQPASATGLHVTVLGAGVTLLAWGAGAGSMLVAAGGAALAAVALTLLVAARRDHDTFASSLVSGQEAARADIRSALARIPIRPEHLERPGDPLARALTQMQALLRDRAHRKRGASAALERAARVDAEARGLAAALDGTSGDGVGPGTAEGLAQALDLAVRRAERLEHTAGAAEREARRLDAERATVSTRLDALAPELDALRAAGEALVSGDAHAGLQEALRRQTAHRRAEELEEELEQAHPDLAALESRIDADDEASAAVSLDDEQLAVVRARIERVDEEIEGLLKRSEAVARDADHLRGLETVDAVDSEIASLAEEQARLARERDRKWILAKLLREADRRFREEHQPDLLRRASSYLRHLTGGRYERLVVDEGAEGDLFHVVGPGLPAPVALTPPVSTGTLEQAYLSLRLAIVDHLDQRGERLPLFVDEVFVNWDSERRARGLEVVSGLSQVRQVFVFTCHDGVAADLERRGARVLSLGAG